MCYKYGAGQKMPTQTYPIANDGQVKELCRNLLVVQGDIGPPEIFRHNMYLGDIAVIRWVPHEVKIVPALQK